MDFVIGALAASGAGFFTNPLDVLKTRMQLQGELRARGQHAVHYRNVFHAAIVVVKNDGILGLQKGLPAAVVMHGIRNCVRLGGYQWAHKRGYVTDEHGKTVFYKGFCVSALTGAAGAFFGSPLFLIKTQMQSQSTKSVAVGYQHGRTGTLSAIKEIYTEHGVKYFNYAILS
uniref:Solute carrier family 25 member 35 n=1 Tax=Photinus pyralis TaxID=7054 RepID=A0A1Y1M409_PHOPY